MKRMVIAPLLLQTDPASAFVAHPGALRVRTGSSTILAGGHFGDGPLPPEGKLWGEEVDHLASLRSLARTSYTKRAELLREMPVGEKRAMLGGRAITSPAIHAFAEEFDWQSTKPESGQFSPRAALGFSLLITHAYETFSSLKETSSDHRLCRILEKAGNKVSHLGLDAYSGRALLLAKRNELSIVVPGTRNKHDAMRDFDLWKSKEEKGCVHSGFQKSADALMPEIFDALEKIRSDYPGKIIKVSLCGHSMGGSIALILANRLFHQPNVEIMTVYTFGSPKTFDKREAELYAAKGLSEKTWRVVNRRDAAVFFPNTALSPKYQHAGNHLYISSDGTLMTNPEENTVREDRGRVVRLFDFIVQGGKAEPLADHSVRSYAKCMYLHHRTKKNEISLAEGK